MSAYMLTYIPQNYTLLYLMNKNHRVVSLAMDETDRVNVTQKIIREVHERVIGVAADIEYLNCINFETKKCIDFMLKVMKPSLHLLLIACQVSTAYNIYNRINIRRLSKLLMNFVHFNYI